MDEELKKPQNRKVFGITVAIIGLIGSIISIYAFFVQTNKPNLECEIIAESNVFDINADISNLDIIYNNNSLKQSGKNLKLLQVKFVNTGTGDILINQFDPSYPITLNIVNAEMVEKPEVVNTSNDYLSSIIKVNSVNNSIVFPSFILDRNQFFILKLLVLCDNSTDLKLDVSGKIAGQKKITISSKISNNANQSFVNKTFNGNVLIQIVRAFVYTIATILVGILIGITVSKIIDFSNRCRRKKDVKSYKKSSDTENSKINQIIFSYYIDGNLDDLKTMQKILTDEKDINEYYKKQNKQKKNDASVEYSDIYEREFKYISRHNRSYCKKMISIGLVICDKSTYRINEDLFNLLTSFVEYIKTHNKKEFERNEYIIRSIEEKKES